MTLNPYIGDMDPFEPAEDEAKRIQATRRLIELTAPPIPGHKLLERERFGRMPNNSLPVQHIFNRNY